MTTNQKLLAASNRIALSAILHDIGKFAERAKIEIETSKLEDEKSWYCPRRNDLYYTHIHAAYTSAAVELIEPYLPKLTGYDVFPFGAWRTKDVSDSLINAAAAHHKPESFLQWIIATADRVASGFEREKFEEYNQADEGTFTKKNHYTARQLTLFEQVFGTNTFNYRYKLAALSPDNIFPIKAQDYETDDKETAQAEYRRLWDAFVLALQEIPESHKANLDLWLDHFDTLWLTYTHAIPSATAFNTKPDVSLYDHSKATAALATALWRYHHEMGKENVEDVKDWDDHKLLLIQGDFFGIQDFIFTDGSDTQKHAAKLLRGRSFYVSLLVECAALKVLQALELPSTSQIINAAGKFLIVAPNTTNTEQKLAQVKAELDNWFLQNSYGQAGIGLAYTPACCKDFSQKKFSELQTRLFQQLEISKLQRFDLCNETHSVFSNYLDSFNNELGVCKVNGRYPAATKDGLCTLSADQILIGTQLTKQNRLLISQKSISENGLKLPIFGYHIYFTPHEAVSGKFGQEARNGNLLRVWDFSEPEFSHAALWNGYARRNINGYVAEFSGDDLRSRDKYGNEQDGVELEKIKTLNHLSCENRVLTEDGKYIGQVALMTLKGDIDDLGRIMRDGLKGQLTFAKMAGLSRQFNFFFAVYLPWLCKKDFPNAYTVFAGGDDFFLIGPWHEQIKLAERMQQEFVRYVVNKDIHFSVGLSMSKPGLPIRQLADCAEDALSAAKANDKNSVCCFNQTVKWDTFKKLLESSQRLDELRTNYQLSTGYIYGLLTLTEKADSKQPEDAIWRSWLAYRTRRFVVDKLKGEEADKRRIHTELVQDIGEQGIGKHKMSYKIALFKHLYQLRE